MSEQKQVAIVTGASRGIGAAIARRLGRAGMAVVVNYARGRAEAEKVVAEVVATGGQGIAVEADLSAADGARKLFDAAEKAYGRVDVLVNNAGIMKLAPIAEVTDEDLDAHLAVNLAGVLRGMREAARRLHEGGRIVSVSTSVVGLYQPRYGVYAATKAAVETLTHILAKELGPRGITVNAVAPGPVETELFLSDKTEDQVNAIRKMNPFGRLGRPEDIADVVAWLASEEARWVSGQVIRANGGVL